MPNREPNHTRAALQARPDLVIVPEPGGAATVKDPVSLKYFRLGAREHWLLRQMRRPITPDELRRRHNADRGDDPLSAGEALAFCAAMSRCGLLVGADGAGDSPPRSERWNPLAIKLPGVDPTPLLDRLGGLGRCLYSWPAAAAAIGAALVVAALLLGRADVLVAELRAIASASDPRLALVGVGVLVVTKFWHELGHALAGRRMGCECHDAGVVLLALAPCAYCDVSDAWTLTSRGRRAVVALGGVYFELLLATAAAAAWLVLQPGLPRSVAVITAVVASASTVFVNLNPLVRFDGYYLLADACGVANLHQQSRAALWGGLRRWIAGSKAEQQQLDAPRPLLALYAVASTIYLFALLGVLLWAARQAAAAYGVGALGDALLAAVAAGLTTILALGAWRLVSAPMPGKRLAAALRLAGVAAIGAAIVAGLLGVPREQTLLAPCRLQAAASASVSAPFAGDLVRLVGYGERVEPGQPIARVLDAEQTSRRLEVLEQLAACEARVAALERLAVRDRSLAVERAREATRLAELQRQAKTLERLAESGKLCASLGGRVAQPTTLRDRSLGVAESGELPFWTGAPLDEANAGCVVQAGDELGVVVSDELRAVVLLDQHDSGLVAVGDPVRVALDRDPASVLRGVVEAVALAPSEEPGARPGAPGDVALEAALRDPLREQATYRIWVRLADTTAACQPGALGQARVVTGRETVLGSLWRWGRRVLWLDAFAAG